MSREDQMQQAMMSMFGMGGALGEEDEKWEGTKFTVSSIDDLLEPLLVMLNVIKGIGTALFIILVVITMVGLMNTFRMILIERTTEIGTIRAIGMQRTEVRNIFLFEALFLALAGAVGGIIISVITGQLLQLWSVPIDNPAQLFTNQGHFTFPFVIPDVAGTVAILSFITLLAAYLPARKAAKMEPAAALRTTY